MQSPKLSISERIFRTENPRLLKYGLDAIQYLPSQLWQQVSIDIRAAASLVFFQKSH